MNRIYSTANYRAKNISVENIKKKIMQKDKKYPIKINEKKNPYENT